MADRDDTYRDNDLVRIVGGGHHENEIGKISGSVDTIDGTAGHWVHIPRTGGYLSTYVEARHLQHISDDPKPADPLAAYRDLANEETPEERTARHELNKPLIAAVDALAAELRASKRADPLLAFRDLAEGASVYDRASGVPVGTFEGLDTWKGGEMIRVYSVRTGHTAWSSGLALTPRMGECSMVPAPS